MLDPGAATPVGAFGVTPAGAMAAAMATPTPGQMAFMQTPEQQLAARWEAEIDERNRPITDEELDAIFPAEG